MDTTHLVLVTASIVLTVLMAIFSVGYRLLRIWEADRREQREEERLSHHARLRHIEEQALSFTVDKNPPPEDQSGGYIILNLPEDQKPLFHDVLKGFEEWAALKGYEIKFSIDNSLQDKIAFKFTIPTGVTVSTDRVKNDLREYIEKVQKGDPLDDVPIVISEPRHHSLLLAMRNRINFLHHTYTAQQNVIACYEEMMRSIKGGTGLASGNNIYVSGGTMTPHQYTAVGSQNVAQGHGNESSHNLIDQSIRVGHSFNERKDQLESLVHLINTLRSSENASSEPVNRAVINLEKVRDELSNEEQPDGSRIKKWLETAKGLIGTLALSHELLEIAKGVFSKFNLSL